MFKIINLSLYKFTFSLLLATFFLSAQADAQNKTYSEAEFIKMVMDKPIQEVKDIIGEPIDIVKNGDMEFLLYAALVHQGKTDKLFRYTQISVTKGLVQNVGNSNRSMNK